MHTSDMQDYRVALCLAAAAALLASTLADGASTIVGGGSQWSTGVVYPPISAILGETLQFSWARGQHNVVQLSTPDCSFNGASKELAGYADTPFNLVMNQTGTFYYACSVPGHCQAGMLLTVHVSDKTAMAPAPGPAVVAPASVPAAAPSAHGVYAPKAVGASVCQPPVLVAGTLDTVQVSCRSAGIPLAPSQVVNYFYELANPYPDKLVAVINQTSQIIDAQGRPVPLSEAYCHHFFGDGRFVAGEGAELRGSETRQPLPEPYYYIVNGTYFDDPARRRTNIHLINTVGVADYNLGPCVECWCRDKKKAAAEGYYGGTACCTPMNCNSTLSVDPATLYHLQYNITYRSTANLSNPQQAHLWLMDTVGGNVEYDVFAGEPGSIDVQKFTGAIDDRCPQTADFGVLRCTGHQHIGGICMEMYDTASGHLICSSCAEYGNSSSVATPGEEHSYLVKMSDDTLLPPYRLAPGQNITLVSRYDSSVDHFGVMALYILTLVDWDPLCPGNPTGAAAVSYTQTDIFTTFTGPANSSVPNAAAY